MNENKLPEGVGKKIVEALKKQSEVDSPVQEEQVDNLGETISAEEKAFQDLITDEVEEVFAAETSVETPDAQDFEESSLDDLDMAFSSEEQQYADEPVIEQEPEIQPQYSQPEQTAQSQQSQQSAPSEPAYSYSQQPQMNYQQASYQRAPEYSAPQYQPQQEQSPTQEFNIPANVAVLKRLINQLPQGVSKQTGAQIIRQTMEALGISMSTVLAEAQHFQDELNVSVKHCASNIQEYKTSIKNLEKQVGDYQRQSMQVNDLISLFIMTDK